MDETKPEAAAPDHGDGLPVEPVGDARETESKEGVPQEKLPAKDGATSNGQTSMSAILQTFTDKALHFLSHASNETLGACLVGLGATTYIVLGRVGLVVIGLAGGVVLHATWAGIRHDDRDEQTIKAEQEQRREAGIEVAKRLLDWRTSSAGEQQKDEDVKVYAHRQLDFSSFGPETEVALNTFTDAIIKDYVHYWYDPTIPEENSFPASCKQTLTAFLLSLAGHMRRQRPADVFLDFVTNASSIIIVFLDELSAALNASPNSSAEDAVATYLELKPDSSLSYMLNQDSQKAKLADAAEDVLQAYLDPKAYNCPPIHVFLKQVLAQLVLGYTVTYCSRPEFINDWIVYGLEESKTTEKVMDLVDAGVGGKLRDDPPVRAADVIARSEVTATKQETAANTLPLDPARPEPKRYVSQGEEAMDEAMREARRLTQLMIEEDERKAREEHEKHAALSSSEDVSDANTHGAPTPTSSQSDRERGDDDATASSSRASSGMLERPVTTGSRPVTPTTNKQFTSFDQLIPSSEPSAFFGSPERSRNDAAAELTLHNANISIFDDSMPGERASIKAKPTADYLIQIEPSSSAFPGWMIARKYVDFETLHEVLRRISVITGVPDFARAHAELPKWRTSTKANLRNELERYMTDAVRFQPLAESEGMKRFLEKDQGLAKSPSERGKGFGWPTPDAFGKFGGDMMNVLTKAPLQVAGGGKAVFGGVAGLGKRLANPTFPVSGRPSREQSAQSPARKSRTELGQSFTSESYADSVASDSVRKSQDSFRSMTKPLHERQESIATTASSELKPRPSVASSRPSSDLARTTESEAEPTQAEPQLQVAGLDGGLEAAISLPPPPSEIPDDFGVVKHNPSAPPLHSTTSVFQDAEGQAPPTPPRPAKPTTTAAPPTPAKPKAPLTERETSVAIELMFAVITELYTLSSAWQIRRTLLAAAKTFLLRPGNPQLLTIRDMLQQSLLDDNLSDAGIAAQIYKLRENSLPTAEEMEVWNRDFPEKTAEQKEELKVKARRLLVTKGMPQALTSVMGAAASGEALGKVFDCLQVPEVGRGLVFGLVLQALRVITH